MATQSDIGGAPSPPTQHPLSSLFPPMTAETFADLVASIRERGYDPAFPIIMYEGQILDGVHRWRAAETVGVAPIVQAYAGENPLRFVLSANLDRRHLDASQRAMIAAKVTTMRQGERTDLHPPATTSSNSKKLSLLEASKLLHVAHGQVSDARVVRERAAPEMVKAVEDGVVAVSTAKILTTLPVEEQAAIATADDRTRPHLIRAGKARALRATRTPPPRAKSNLKGPAPSEGSTRRLVADYPAPYVALILTRAPEAVRAAFLHRLQFAHAPGTVVRRPRPSELFPAIKPSLDERLIRDQRDTDVACLEALAAVPATEQREFYERTLAGGVANAELWQRLERYKRPLIAATSQDHLIWKLFTVMRLQVEYMATPTRDGWPLAGIGRSLVQQAGLVRDITEHEKLADVLSTYGSMLAHGEDVGDVGHPPWTRSP